MHSTLVRLTGITTMIAAAGLAFGQGLGVAPAFPEGASALTVTDQAGPWMILAASYTGQPARGQAEELATEIRARYNLPAYVFNRTGAERRREQERVAKLKEERRQQIVAAGLPADTPVHIKTIRIEDQYAVLVGGYKDDVMARKDLDRIRTLKPSDKYLKSAYVPDEKGKMHEEAINPFQSAFVCRNPAIPIEKPAQDTGPDPRLKQYNADESYSLLKCGKPWTLVVKVYKGASMIQAQGSSGSVMERMGLARKSGELLNANGNEAHKVAEVLRTKPKQVRTQQVGVSFDAFVMHTEYNSYVTIGAFDSPDEPQVTQTMQAFLNEMERPGSAVNQLHTKVQFLARPTPMPVPQVK
jgi:hypothetical protein